MFDLRLFSSNPQQAKNWPELVRSTGIVMFAAGLVILDSCCGVVGRFVRLECFRRRPDNAAMEMTGQFELPGHVENGVVVLEGGASLPEGAQVRVRFAGGPTIHVSGIRKPVQLPLIKTGEPGSLDLTNDRIAEILNEEDAEGVNRSWNAPP